MVSFRFVCGSLDTLFGLNSGIGGRKPMKKIGVQNIFIAAVILIVAMVAVNVVSLTMLDGFVKDILVERANVGMSVTENDMAAQYDKIADNIAIWSGKPETEEAIKSGSAAGLQADWDANYFNGYNFCAILDSNNNFIFKSDEQKINSLAFTAYGSTMSGVVRMGSNGLAIFHTNPVQDENTGAVIGSILIGRDLSNSSWIDNVKTQSGSDITIFCDDVRLSTTMMNNGVRNVGSKMLPNLKTAVIDNKQNYVGQTNINGTDYVIDYKPLYDINNNVVGALAATSDVQSANDEFGRVVLIVIVIAIVVGVGGAVVIAVFTRKKVTTPINMVTILAHEMQDGKLDTTEVNYEFADDEVGGFAKLLMQTKKDLNEVVGDSSRILSSMASGDFTETPNTKYPGVFEDIKTNIIKIEDDLGAALSRMNLSSEEVLTGSNQMAEGSQSLADGTTRQASAIEEISASIAEVSTQISNTAQNAQQAGDLSKQTQERVNYQDGEIKNMVKAMEEISSTSQEIEKIIKTIEDIAFQTNILALNAAVEAARAGDAGKGFAVVADEVRNLASKSAEAASSTTSLITASIDAVDKGSKIAFATADSMKEVKDMSAKTAELVVQIASASAEQTESIRQITAGIEQISQVIQTNSATAEETAASCEELSGQSKILKDQVARFKINQ